MIPKRGKDFCPALIDSIGMKDSLIDSYEDSKDELFAKVTDKEDPSYAKGQTIRYNADASSECNGDGPCFHKLFYLAGLEYLDWDANNYAT